MVQMEIKGSDDDLTVKGYWELFMGCSLNSLKEVDTVVDTRIQVDQYLTAQVRKVRESQSQGVGAVYRQLEVSMRDIQQLVDRWQQFNLTLHSDEGALPAVLSPPNLLLTLQQLLTEVAPMDIQGAEKLQLLADQGSWLEVQNSVIAFNRRHVGLGKVKVNTHGSLGTVTAKKLDNPNPNRVMYTDSRKEIPRGKLQQIVRNAVEVAGIKLSRDSYSSSDYSLIRGILDLHLEYNNWSCPKTWCLVCGGDHKKRACPSCHE